MQEHKRNIRRGNIYYADLTSTVGCEQGGIRPVLIIQNDIGNRYSPTVIVAAITSRPKKEMPTHVAIGKESVQLSESFALLEQIRTIDRMRLKERAGSISDDEMEKVNQALSISVGLDPAYC